MATVHPNSSLLRVNYWRYMFIFCCHLATIDGQQNNGIGEDETYVALSPSLLDDDEASPLRTQGLTQNDRGIYYKDIAAGEALILSCIGTRAIGWHYPAHLDNNISNKKRLKITRDKEAGLIRSTLVVRKAQYNDTGLYRCYFTDDEQSASVFVFVNDYENLFATPMQAGGELMMALQQAQTGTFPCTPSFSYARVKLYRVQHDGEELVPLSRDASGQFQYAPTRGGILIPFPELLMRGRYVCRAEVDGPEYGESHTNDLRIRIAMFIANEKLPPPTIDMSAADRHVTEGGILRLSCLVQQSSPISRLHLQWTGPTASAQQRMVVTPILKTVVENSNNNDDGQQSKVFTYRRNFTLTNVNARTDNGAYTCQAMREGGTIVDMSESNVTIRAYRAHQHSHINFLSTTSSIVVVNLTTPVEDDVVVSNGDFVAKYLPQEVNIIAALDIYPLPPKLLQWRKGDRLLQASNSADNHSKYAIFNTVDYSMSFLKIIDIRSVLDMGNFTLHVETADLKRSTNFQLIINAAPFLWPMALDHNNGEKDDGNLNNNVQENLHAPYQVALYDAHAPPGVVCCASGHPRPAVTWYTYECSSGAARACVEAAASLDKQSKKWKQVKNQFVSTESTQYGTSSTLQVPHNSAKPVWFRCDALNNIFALNSSSASVSQMLLALPSGGEVIGPLAAAQAVVSPAEPLMDDRLVLTCRANAMLYQHARLQNVQVVPDLRTLQKRSFAHDERYMLSDNLELFGFAVETEVFATCEFQPMDSTQPLFVRNLTFTINAASAPIIRHVLPKNRLVTVTYDESLTLFCNASFDRPAANYTWLKNQKPLTSGKASHRIQNNGKTLELTRVVEEDGGVYSCVVSNRVGTSQHDWTVAVGGDPQGETAYKRKKLTAIMVIVLASALIFLIMLCCVVFLCIKWHKERTLRRQLQKIERIQKTKGDLARLKPDVALSQQAAYLEFKDQFEFPRDKLKLFPDTELGQGKFGKVVLAEALGIASSSVDVKLQPNGQQWIRVAVKMPRDAGNAEQLNMLMSESKVHMFVGYHVNVVNLLGTVTKNFQLGEMLAVLEYCGNGSLKTFLQRQRRLMLENRDGSPADVLETNLVENQSLPQYSQVSQEEEKSLVPVNISHLLAFCCQIACGMSFLASKRVIHRDLATRNVLVNEALIVKIADFGLARRAENSKNNPDIEDDNEDAQYSRSAHKKYHEEPLPIKWLAPECTVNGHFTTASDVWSYGVVVWEIFSFGLEPYPYDKPGRELMQRIVLGYRMQQPAFAPPQAHTIMLLCWDAEPKQRPTFDELQRLILRLMDTNQLADYQHIYSNSDNAYNYMHLLAPTCNEIVSNRQRLVNRTTNKNRKHEISESQQVENEETPESYCDSPSTALTYADDSAGSETSPRTARSLAAEAARNKWRKNASYAASAAVKSDMMTERSAVTDDIELANLKCLPNSTEKFARSETRVLSESHVKPTASLEDESYINEQFSPARMSP